MVLDIHLDPRAVEAHVAVAVQDQQGGRKRSADQQRKGWARTDGSDRILMVHYKWPLDEVARQTSPVDGGTPAGSDDAEGSPRVLGASRSNREKLHPELVEIHAPPYALVPLMTCACRSDLTWHSLGSCDGSTRVVGHIDPN